MVRLDNIMYHSLMKFNTSPQTCAPYCFPTSKLGENGVAVSGEGLKYAKQLLTCVVAGCVKYCTPTQYDRNPDTSLTPSPCRCTMLKRLDCFKHKHKHGIVCGTAS